MKLYLSPGACSMAPHIVLCELGLKHTTEMVDLRSQPHVLAGTQTSYATVNPKGSVPALQLDDGQVLTENAVILQYLADQKPDAGLLPAIGTLARYRALEWLSFVSSDVHKAIGAFWNPTLADDAKGVFRQNVDRRLAFVEKYLANNQYLGGDRFSIADAYLFVVVRWMPHLKLDMEAYPNLKAFQARIAARPAVTQAIKAEGLN